MVADYIVGRLKARDVQTDLIDVADYPLAGTGSASATHSLDHYRRIVEDADGFVIVAPEYNHGYPGELKLLLDSDHAGYRHKPAGLVGVSAGRIGGARMIGQLQVVSLALGLIPVSPTVLVSEVASAFDRAGEMLHESQREVVERMLEEVEALADRLEPGRT